MGCLRCGGETGSPYVMRCAYCSALHDEETREAAKRAEEARWREDLERRSRELMKRAANRVWNP